MAFLVNTYSIQQQTELKDFLQYKGYEFKLNNDIQFTERETDHVLKLDGANTDRHTDKRSMEEIRKELKSAIVVLLREAGIDIQNPCSWYENPHIGLTGKLLDEIDDYFDLIKQNPLL